MSATGTAAKHPLGKAIREARKEQDISQVELADRLGLAQPYVSAWETFRVPTVDQVADIETALKLPAGAILRSAGYVTDTDVMTLEQRIAIDSTISRAARQTLLSVVVADRLREQSEGTPRRSRTSE